MKKLSLREEQELFSRLRERDKLLDLAYEVGEGRRPSLKELSERTGRSPFDIKTTLLSGEKAREQLVILNQGLIYKMMQPYLKDYKSSKDDLISEGNIGLLKAIDRFDPKKGRKFSTFATPYIKGQLSAYASQKTRNVRIPQWKTASMRKLTKAETDLRNKKGREPRPEEAAEILGWSVEFVRELHALKNSERSMNAASTSEGEAEFIDLLRKDDDSSFWQEEFQRIQKEGVRVFLQDTLPKEGLHKKVIKMRFGFQGKPKSLPEIAGKLNLSYKKTKSIYFSSLEMLRRRRSHLMWLLGEDV